jgi:hypothetical protein
MHLKGVRIIFINENMKKKIMIFHKANKPSFNISWGHSKTLNVIPFQWFLII